MGDTRKRLVGAFIIISLMVFGLIIRIGYLQIIEGQAYKKQALDQWAKDIVVKANRGTIYDRNGKKLATNIKAYTISASPGKIDKPGEISERLAPILEMDESEVYKKITTKGNFIKIKQWVNEETMEKVRAEEIDGIFISEVTKRYYPFGNLASYVLGFTNIDNKGLYGIERNYDKYLIGTQGRLIKNSDAFGRQIPYENEKVFEAEPGANLVLTLDEVVQGFAEDAAEKVLNEYSAKKASVIVMDPNTGDILAMTSKPDYNPNTPREPISEYIKKKWEGLSSDELTKEWNKLWKPFPINDVYEPGSPFKLLTAAIALEENLVKVNTKFQADKGYIKVGNSRPIKCWRYYEPHGEQTVAEGVQNSCNVVLVQIGLKIGQEKMDNYIRAFGFGEKTNIDIIGEELGLVTSAQNMRDIRLANISFGQGIGVTQIQLINSIATLINGGNLMEPRFVKQIIDEEGNALKEFKPKVKRKVLSKDTSDKMRYIMETVVTEGGGKNAYIPGYRVGGKTGTAQKIVNGRYSDDKYIMSFVAAAPMDNPQLITLVVVDEPIGDNLFASTVAIPPAKEVLEKSLRYLKIPPSPTDGE